jgi:hypothetical protein
VLTKSIYLFPRRSPECALGSMWRMCAPMFTPANPTSRKNEGVKGVSGNPYVYIPTSDAFAIAFGGIPACWATSARFGSIPK